MNRATRLVAACALWAAGGGGAASAADQPPAAPVPPVVKILVTHQSYEPAAPWNKRSDEERAGYGCVLPSGGILTTAQIVKNRTFIRVTKSTSGEYIPATVEAADYDADLALLRVADPRYLDDVAPCTLAPDVPLDSPVHFAVFGDAGDVRAIPGTIVKASVGSYALGVMDYLLYGATVNFEGQGGGWSEPVFFGGELAGLAKSYSGSKQNAQVIPSSIIRHFLEGIGPGGYRGFPYHGFWVTTIRDPVTKRFLGMPDGVEGLYVRYVVPGGSADGVLRVGDVVTAVDGHALDWDGNYRHPLWGKLDYQDLFCRMHFPGDAVDVDLIRDKKPARLRMTLKRLDQEQYLVPVEPSNPRPPYLIVGGLVIQELTTGYLRAWGKEWKDKAEKRLLFYERCEWLNQRPERRRIVILNRVLPDESVDGYQDMKDLVIVRVNGRVVSDLCDVAEALRSPENGLHRIAFKQFNAEIALDAEECAAAAERLAARYGVGEMRWLPECERGTAIRGRAPATD